MKFDYTMDFRVRTTKMQNYMKENDIELVLVLNPDNMFYFASYSSLVPLTRLAVLCIAQDKSYLIAPHVEGVNAVNYSLKTGYVDEVLMYDEIPVEFPKVNSPFPILKDIINTCAPRGRIGVEFCVISHEMCNFIIDNGGKLIDIYPQIALQRAIKAEDELACMKAAARLCEISLGAIFENIREGITEAQLQEIGTDAVHKYASENYHGVSIACFGNVLGGPLRTTMPHNHAGNYRLQKGDTIVCSRQVAVNGLQAELERTCFLGEPSEKQKELFSAMRKAQRKVIDTVRPEIRCCDVDKAAFDVLKELQLDSYVIHRSGHGIGLTTHETPVLSFADDTMIQPRMCFSAEPGIYVPDVGGTRHSDTIIVTDSGCELMTHFASELEDMIIE